MSSIPKGIIPIQEKFLQPNQLMIVQFREGFVFGRVIRRRITQYEKYKVIDANGNEQDIAATSSVGEFRFRDPRNTNVDVLYLDTETNTGLAWLFHGAFGIKPMYINMYPRQPEGETIPGKFPSVDPIRPGSGDRITALNSVKSPYDCPTDYHEFVIPPKMHIGAEYYNRDSKAHVPVLNILFALYWFQPLPPEIYPRLVSGMATKKVTADILTVGFGDLPEQFYSLDDWGVEPITLEEAGELR